MWSRSCFFFHWVLCGAAPAYKLAKHLTKILNQHINLNNRYNLTNSTNLANDLIKLPVHDNYRMITFDIKDLYVNIPIDETLNIIKTKLYNKMTPKQHIKSYVY